MRRHSSRHSSLELDDLRAVVALAEELNFHRAARKVDLTQSGLTRVIARVERQVRACLFERSHSKRQSVTLTDAGRCYVERVRVAIAHWENADVAARETLNGVENLILAGKTQFADLRLVAVLRAIELPLYPKLRVDFRTKSADELLASVRSGEFNLAVITNPPKDVLLSFTPLRCTPFTVVLPEEHKCANKKEVMLKDLASTPWILIDRNVHFAHYDTLRHRAQELGVGMECIHHIADAEEAYEMVRAIGGAAFLPLHGAAQVAKDGVVLCSLDEQDILLTSHLVVREDNFSKLLSELVRTFVKRLKLTQLYQPVLPESAIGADCAALCLSAHSTPMTVGR